ncbi:MAG: hypothetical protein ACOC5K_03215 [Chloroflexota bacterium]
MIGGFSVLVGAALAAAWLGETVPMVLFDQSSNLLMEQASPALFIQALDLGLIVPLAMVGGVLLWKDSRLGYFLASIFLMKAVTLFTAVFAMAALMLARDAGGSVGELAVTGIGDIVGIMLAAVFFLRMRDRPLQHREP